MEGVLVSAKGAGTNMTITVVSDNKGRYRFPRAKLKPGKYSISIRAAGYEIGSPRAMAPAKAARTDPDMHTAPLVAPAEVAPDKTTQVDLKLAKAADLASQLSKPDWVV